MTKLRSNQVHVMLTADDGSTVSEYEAAVARRGESEGRLHWEALVAGAVTFEVSFVVKTGELTDPRFEGITSHATTNRMKLAEAILARELSTSTRVSFQVAAQTFFALGLTPKTDEELKYIDVSIDTLYDLVVIENITGRALEPLTGNYQSSDRALLRLTRLLWEGEVVPFQSGPLQATAPADVVPQVVVLPASSSSIATTDVPFPTTHVRHPLMEAASVTPVPGSDPPTHSVELVVPLDEPFVAWAPEKRQIAGDDDLRHPRRLGLLHLDERAFLGGE